MILLSVMLTTVVLLWAASLIYLWRTHGALLRRTWNEPYFLDVPVLIESDDWGPGPDWHAERLSALTVLLARYRDSAGRRAVLTADTILAVPDPGPLHEGRAARYERRFLDEGY